MNITQITKITEETKQYVDVDELGYTISKEIEDYTKEVLNIGEYTDKFIYEEMTKEEINKRIKYALSKKERKKFLSNLQGIYRIVKAMDIEIDKDLYNLISFAKDVMEGRKKIEKYI